ncbi:unnamed protein product [Auanema sp. JU1783]|nr:unnamed protein product [Auanema sp. JU1783]
MYENASKTSTIDYSETDVGESSTSSTSNEHDDQHLHNMQSLYQLSGNPGVLQQLQQAAHHQQQLAAASVASMQSHNGMLLQSASSLMAASPSGEQNIKDDQAEFDLQIQIQQQMAANQLHAASSSQATGSSATSIVDVPPASMFCV